MKAFFISLLLGCIVGSVGYFGAHALFAGKGPAPATVAYTDTGFYPATTTISKGATVTWVNKSSVGMWIGSGHHPIHDEYPEHEPGDCSNSRFDTCREIAPGESWSFTIDLPGTWHYHNHLKDEDGGVIVVPE